MLVKCGEFKRGCSSSWKGSVTGFVVSNKISIIHFRIGRSWLVPREEGINRPERTSRWVLSGVFLQWSRTHTGMFLIWNTPTLNHKSVLLAFFSAGADLWFEVGVFRSNVIDPWNTPTLLLQCRRRLLRFEVGVFICNRDIGKWMILVDVVAWEEACALPWQGCKNVEQTEIKKSV